MCSDQVPEHAEETSPADAGLDEDDQDFCTENHYIIHAGLACHGHRSGRCLRTDRRVFIKKRKLEPEEGIPGELVREIRVLKEAQHPNVVKLYRVHQSPDRLRMVLELLDLDLTQYLATRGPFKGADLAGATCHCFAGLAYCHAHAVLHRFLHPRHVLVELGTMRLVLTGFKVSRPYSVPLRDDDEYPYYRWYCPPELFLGQDGADQVPSFDIWAMGCVMAEMATNSVFSRAGFSNIEQLFKIFNRLGTPTELDWPGVTGLPHYSPAFPKWGGPRLGSLPSLLGHDGMDLLTSCLRYDCRARLTARAALQHAFHRIPCLTV
eukprot:TRINITY_DN112074_c0_g1_i1.p1 TRINITY_DN112074_c0_g1~~TRINITY_DN112074_c0_g1_i1.p1  ORF type:complete len:321 (-),score=26.07 TRINITY_DN112074_c0_g1_i1:106-1068(-)